MFPYFCCFKFYFFSYFLQFFSLSLCFFPFCFFLLSYPFLSLFLLFYPSLFSLLVLFPILQLIFFIFFFFANFSPFMHSPTCYIFHFVSAILPPLFTSLPFSFTSLPHKVPQTTCFYRLCQSAHKQFLYLRNFSV